MPNSLLRTPSRPLLLSFLVGICLPAGAALPQSPLLLTADRAQAGPSISSNFSGLSYETSLALPGRNGRYFFSPSNQPLVRMFRTLGIKSLRVGGNTAERDTVPIPDQAALDSLFAFARATGKSSAGSSPC